MKTIGLVQEHLINLWKTVTPQTGFDVIGCYICGLMVCEHVGRRDGR